MKIRIEMTAEEATNFVQETQPVCNMEEALDKHYSYNTENVKFDYNKGVAEVEISSKFVIFVLKTYGKFLVFVRKFLVDLKKFFGACEEFIDGEAEIAVEENEEKFIQHYIVNDYSEEE